MDECLSGAVSEGAASRPETVLTLGSNVRLVTEEESSVDTDR